MTRILYAADVHGSERTFRKFINGARFYGADVLILGGDITAKMVIPVVHQGSDRYEAHLFDNVEIAHTGEGLVSLEERIANNGLYPYRCEPDELDEILRSKEKQDKIFRRLALASLDRWIGIAENCLKIDKVMCFIMAGNDDDPAVIESLNHGEIVINPEFRRVDLPDGYEMISVGYSNKTPFDSPREMEEDQLYDRIAGCVKMCSGMRLTIFNLHCPPYDSSLDLAPELTKDLQVVIRGGRPAMIPVGSKAVRSAIEEFQPLLGLHGHVHESRGATRIGRTLCLNPGSEYAAGILHGVIVNLEGEKIKGYQFVSG